MHFYLDESGNCTCNGIKAEDCITNFLRRIFRAKLVLQDLSNLKKIFDLPYSIELTHFNKDLPYIESQLSDYASFVLNNLNNNIELKASL